MQVDTDVTRHLEWNVCQAYVFYLRPSQVRATTYTARALPAPYTPRIRECGQTNFLNQIRGHQFALLVMLVQGLPYPFCLFPFQRRKRFCFVRAILTKDALVPLATTSVSSGNAKPH